MICGINADPALCQRLQELGFCEKTCIWKLAGHTHLICQVGAARVALNHLMASRILVQLQDDALSFGSVG
jgi:Fe2+ transport system protein FeoA